MKYEASWEVRISGVIIWTNSQGSSHIRGNGMFSQRSQGAILKCFTLGVLAPLRETLLNREQKAEVSPAVAGTGGE